MLFKLIEAVEVSFVSPRQRYTGEWDKPARSFLAVTYEHWVTIKHSGDENWDEFKSFFNWFWMFGVWGLGFGDMLRIRNEETDTTPSPLSVFGFVAKCYGKKQ